MLLYIVIDYLTFLPYLSHKFATYLSHKFATFILLKQIMILKYFCFIEKING